MLYVVATLLCSSRPPSSGALSPFTRDRASGDCWPTQSHFPLEIQPSSPILIRAEAFLAALPAVAVEQGGPRAILSTLIANDILPGRPGSLPPGPRTSLRRGPDGSGHPASLRRRRGLLRQRRPLDLHPGGGHLGFPLAGTQQGQILSAAVLRILVVLVALERAVPRSIRLPIAGPAKVPAALLRRLAVQVGQQLEAAVPEHWLWQGRHVFLADGTTTSLPDTPENQQAYPQPPAQKPGLGFPLLRMVVLLSLATAALQALAFGRYEGKETGETALFRALLEQIPAGSIILADRYYCSYFLIALLQQSGVDVVFRLHQCRKYDFAGAGGSGRTITS